MLDLYQGTEFCLCSCWYTQWRFMWNRACMKPPRINLWILLCKSWCSDTTRPCARNLRFGDVSNLANLSFRNRTPSPKCLLILLPILLFSFTYAIIHLHFFARLSPCSFFLYRNSWQLRPSCVSYCSLRLLVKKKIYCCTFNLASLSNCYGISNCTGFHIYKLHIQQISRVNMICVF